MKNTSTKSVHLVMGYPASGKSSFTREHFPEDSWTYLNRDSEGGTMDKLAKLLDKRLQEGVTQIVLDNTYPTAESRAPFIAVAKKHGIPIYCTWLKTSIEDSQVNACLRMMERHDKLLTPKEITAAKDPNIFSPVVQFVYRKKLQPPEMSEGFEGISAWNFDRRPDGPSYRRKALLLDYDGTLRECVGGNGKYPIAKDQIRILENRVETLHKYVDQGYQLLGVSNQSGVAAGELTYEEAVELFDYTNKLLDLEIEVAFCPHGPVPISCYCRKPMPGMGIQFMERYKLSRRSTIMVGDRTSDKTFAKRCGIQFIHADKFFEVGK